MQEEGFLPLSAWKGRGRVILAFVSQASGTQYKCGFGGVILQWSFPFPVVGVVRDGASTDYRDSPGSLWGY